MSTELLFENPEYQKIPFNQIVRLGQKSLLYNDLFAVSWLLGRYCNYRCSYCWPYARSDSKDHRPLEVVLKTLAEIKRQARERGFQSFHFSFSGGEPTQHPHYLEILQKYAEDQPNCRYQSMHMTSNCSQPKAWFQKFVEVTRPLHRVSVTSSYHKEFAKKELLRDKLLLLQESEVQVTINMVMVPERFDLLWEDAMFFHSAGLNVTLKPQSNTTASKIVDGYTEEQLNHLQRGLPQVDQVRKRLAETKTKSNRPPLPAGWKTQAPEGPHHQKNQVALYDNEGNTWGLDQAERMNAFSFNNFQGWDCSAGYRSLIIREPGGTIKRGYSCSDQPLGTIDTGFQLFDQVQPCRSKSCVSSADSKIPKKNSQDLGPLWETNGK